MSGSQVPIPLGYWIFILGIWFHISKVDFLSVFWGEVALASRVELRPGEVA